MNADPYLDMAPFLDMMAVPFTDRYSRLLAYRTADGSGLRLATAEYERDPDDCVLLPRLEVARPAGATGPGGVVPVRGAWPDRAELDGGAGSLVFAGPDTLSLGLRPGAWTLTLEVPEATLSADGGHWYPGLPSAPAAAWRVVAASCRQQAEPGPAGVRVRIEVSDPDGAQLIIAAPSAPAAPDAPLPSAAQHPVLLAGAAGRWASWFGRLPAVPAHLAPMLRTAWWALGVNTIAIGAAPAGTGQINTGQAGVPDEAAHRRYEVVPAKPGYVGHWQWDAYFIVTGLRHGAPELARDQIRTVLEHQLPDGMFADVVHDGGVLASTGELPPGDVARLVAAHNAGSGPAPATAPVPVTKPPLTAWAVAKLHEASPDPDFLAECFGAIERSQRWWLTVSDTDGDGLAEYLHPYSSGLDDSPVFEHGVPAATADLNTYLTVQFDELARIAGWLGRPADQARLRDAAAAHAARLIARQWDPGAGRFRPLVRGELLDVHTVTDLLPLLTGRLPAGIADAIAADLASPGTFGPDLDSAGGGAGGRTVPTVSRADRRYDPDRMWRGPVWANINYLLIEGLRRHGHAAAAAALTERTLELICDAGPYEYFNADTGRPGRRAVPMFSWTAAVFVDLAAGQVPER